MDLETNHGPFCICARVLLVQIGAARELSVRAYFGLSRGYPVLAIGIMMGLAIMLCICSQADAFVAASFVTVRPASKLAFLVLGPMLDFKLYAMYTRVFRPRLIWTVVSSVVIQVFLYSLITHMIWENYHEQITNWLGRLRVRWTTPPVRRSSTSGSSSALFSGAFIAISLR